MTLRTRWLSLLLALAAGTAAAQTAPVELRYATVAPERSVWGAQITRWAADVAAEIGGAVKVQPYWSGQLGAEADIIQQVARGRIDAGATGIAFGALLAPELQLVLLPGYFRSAAEQDCVLDGGLQAHIAERLAGKGLQLIGLAEAGSIVMIGKRPFASPADLTGAKAGFYGNRMGTLMWQALGANPTQTSSTELAAGLQTGLIDVAGTVPVLYVGAGINKVAPVATRFELMYMPSIVVVNKAAWERLAPAQQEAVRRATERQPAARMRAEVRAQEQQMLQAHVQGGGQLVEPTPAQREAFRRALAPSWPRMVEEAGPEGARFFERMEAGRKACEGRS